jgi:3-oxoacyl-[acyl-carrier protein] reductase
MSEAVLEGRIALVTGASRGIGRAIAQELAAAGATVVGTATSAAGAESITEALAPQGGRGAVLNVDDAAACDALLAELAGQGGPHILVNNAGITRDGLILRMKDEDWAAVLNTNLSAVFRLSRGVAKTMMKARWGRIVNITALNETQTAAILQQIPLGRLGSAAEIAHAVAYLASPQAGYVTGTTLHVNGGMYM